MNADPDLLRRVAEAVRRTCLEEAQSAYEQGGLSGLCVEGRWDLAMDRLRTVDVDAVVREVLRHGSEVSG